MDQRQHPRFAVRMRAILGPLDAEGKEGTIYNVSMGGCAVRSQTAVDVDLLTSLQIFTRPIEEPIFIAGAVKRWGAHSLHCFQFLSISEDNRTRLQRLLTDLNSTVDLPQGGEHQSGGPPAADIPTIEDAH